MSRLFIYGKDVQLITGKSERTAFRLINTIKRKLNKARHQALSIAEFSQFMGLNPDEVSAAIR
ncbi:hypothetical protein D3C86_1622490 [compost metagenome]